MTQAAVIFYVPGFVEITHRQDLNAVWIAYAALNDHTGTYIPKAVRAATAFATSHDIPNWVADTARPTDELSELDATWVAGQEFRDIMLGSSISNFVLIPPAPETGADTSWIPEWQASTQAGFGNNIKVEVLDNLTEIKSFFDED